MRFPTGRPALGLLVGCGAVLLVAAVMLPLHQHVGRTTLALLLLVPVVAAAVTGGWMPAAATVVLSAAAYGLYLPPAGSPRVRLREDVVALVAFGIVTAAVGGVLSAERRRRLAQDERNAALEEIDGQRRLLLRSVSHDLRTPLATIGAVITELREPDSAWTPETRHEMLGLAADEVERLDRIVGNLLHLNRIEAGALRPDLRPIVVDDVVRHSGDRLAHLARRTRFRLEPAAGDAIVLVDATHLEQVLTNLVENAARHTGPDGLVRVATARHGDAVELTVEDDGPGVPPGEAERIFEPFGTTAPAGAGVGLAICRAFVEAAGGTIAVVPATVGRGACLRVMLPVHG